jgi:serine/threonine protein kinase
MPLGCAINRTFDEGFRRGIGHYGYRLRAMPLAQGDTFAGFAILRQLGSGGMGEVYLIDHPRLPRREALKILPAALTADDEFRQRFNREADIAADLAPTPYGVRGAPPQDPLIQESPSGRRRSIVPR